MAYVWSKDLETGNATIDSQHKQLVKALNDLLVACSAGKGRVEVEKTVSFLQDYTKKHFADEERLQQQCKYPDYTNHKQLHDQFTKSIDAIALDIRKNGAGISTVGIVNREVGDWLVKHIKKEDAKVAAHAKSV